MWENMKKIKVIVPVKTDIWNNEILRTYERYKDPDTELYVANLKKGPEAIEQHYDKVWSELFTLLEAEKAENERYDGVIIYCFCDPALLAAKEKLSIPVLGIMEAGIHLASMLSRKFSIITTIEEGKQTIEDLLKIYGFERKCVSIRAIGVPVLELSNKQKLMDATLNVCAKAIKEDKAETLVLGCGSMLGIREEVSKVLNIPIVEPGLAALKLCEDMIGLGLSQSKTAFPVPVSIDRCI